MERLHLPYAVCPGQTPRLQLVAYTRGDSVMDIRFISILLETLFG